jgi:hypothetical protein
MDLSKLLPLGAAACLLGAAFPSTALPAEKTVATAVYSRIGNGYKRQPLNDGSFKPEFYALSNGGRIYGTTSDLTVDRVTYPEVAEIAMRLLLRQNYYYAKSREQATLLLVLQWGNTTAFDRSMYDQNISIAGSIFTDLQNALRAANISDVGMVRGAGDIRLDPSGTQPAAPVEAQVAIDRLESAMIQILADNRARDKINEHNARVLGYIDDINDSNDIRRWAGGGDRYTDLIGDIEESRYYIVVSAFDFPELIKSGKKTLLWQTRVSVRTPGNSFDDSVAAMMKSASKYFGQDSGRLIRGEEAKGTVELGDLKFLGEVKERKPTVAPAAKKRSPETKK